MLADIAWRIIVVSPWRLPWSPWTDLEDATRSPAESHELMKRTKAFSATEGPPHSSHLRAQSTVWNPIPLSGLRSWSGPERRDRESARPSLAHANSYVMVMQCQWSRGLAALVFFRSRARDRNPSAHFSRPPVYKLCILEATSMGTQVATKLKKK